MARALTYLVVAATLAVAAPAVAQTATEADKHDEQAKAYFRVGEFGLAAPEFERAFALDATKTAALFNAGLCYENLQDFPKAIDRYKRYVALDPNGNRVAEANARAAALERKLAEAAPVEAAPPEPERGHTRAKMEPGPPAAVTPEPQPATPPGRDAPPRSNKKLVGLVLVGVGAVTLGAGAKFGLDAKGYADDAEELDDSEGDQWDQDIEDSGKAAERNMFIAYGVGTALVVTGAVLYVLGSKADRKRRDVAVVPAISDTAATFSLIGRF